MMARAYVLLWLALPLIGPIACENTECSGQDMCLYVVPENAVGDGVTDDTDAIREALYKKQGPVYLRAGRYLLTGSLRIPSNSGIIGPGVLYQTAECATIINEVGRSFENITIKGITIEKQYRNASEADGIFLRDVKNLTIEDVKITGITSACGVFLRNCSDFSITGCHIHDFLSPLLHRKLPISGRNHDVLGMNLRYCRNGKVTGNIIENLLLTDEAADRCAWQSDGINPGFSERLVISNNVIKGVGEGIDLVGCQGCTVRANMIEECWHFGIKVIHGTCFTAVSGNTIRRASLAGMSLYFGNSLWGESRGNVVSNNVIVNSGAITRDAGVWPTWTVAGIEIVNDNRDGNSVYDYIISNNIIYNEPDYRRCEYGIIERYIEFDSQGEEPVFRNMPVDDGGLFSNKLVGNLIRGVKTPYCTGSEHE